MYPAVGQAALGLECRADDALTASLLQAISDKDTLMEVTAERACMHQLQAGCHAPVGVWCSLERVDVGKASLRAMGVVLSLDGAQRIQALMQGTLAIDSFENIATSADELGRALADELLAAGAGPLLTR
jgi:hydroxymethylbilane synthase